MFQSNTTNLRYAPELSSLESCVCHEDLEITHTFNPCLVDLEDAFRLSYQRYVEERGYVGENSLNRAQRDKQMLWDKHDFDTLRTLHIFARKLDGDRRMVGRVRLIDGNCPISHYEVLQNDLPKMTRETSRLTCDPTFRHARLLEAIFAHIFHTSQEVDTVCFTSFNEESIKRLYSRFGAKPAKIFENPSFEGATSCFYKIRVTGIFDKVPENPVEGRFIRAVRNYANGDSSSARIKVAA
jgi:hypothetical protein